MFSNGPLKADMKRVSEINLTVNGVEYRVLNPDPKMHLNEWLRNHAHLKGTKKLCDEGSCGSCIVSISKDNPLTNPESLMAANSCLLPLMSLNGHHIVTVEGLGGQEEGFHAIQKRFAEKFASQCGYCTPGFVMSAFSCLASDSKGKTREEIEGCVDGNICRCTGYRPILDAMKSFSMESSPVDIEDVRRMKNCVKASVKPSPQIVHHMHDNRSGAIWIEPSSLSEFFKMVKPVQGKQIKLLSGNTSSGIFKNKDKVDIFINLTSLEDFASVKVKENYIEIGAGVTLTKLIEVLEAQVKRSQSFAAISRHLKMVANLPVRNVATWAGNLMILHKYQTFPSDVFIVLESIGATLNIADMDGREKCYKLQDFLDADMKSKVILSCILPFSKANEIVRTYKIMPRSQNCYAYVNAGFAAYFDQDKEIFVGRPTIIFGGLGLKMCRASNVEEFLTGKHLQNELFQDAAKILEGDLKLNKEDKFIEENYCKQVAINLFYKFCLTLRGSNISKRCLSAIEYSDRSLSSGQQSFPVSEDSAPVNQPIEKIEGKLQAAGQLQYVGDMPKYSTEVYASFVTSTKKHPGFIAMFTEKDIPGTNNWLPAPDSEELLVSKKVEFYGQLLAVVIGDSQKHADEIARLVNVEYSDEHKPITSVKEAIEMEQFFPKRFPDKKIGDTEDAFKSCNHIIYGEVECGSQLHFYLEPQTCLVVPNKGEFKIFSATQDARHVQDAASQALGINASRIDVDVPRIGGGFGGKIDYPAQFAAAVSVAANALGRPVRMTMPLGDILKSVGKRAPFIVLYKVGFKNDGSLESCQIKIYCDVGINNIAGDAIIAASFVDNAYFCPNWDISIVECKTNTPHNTFMRAPGVLAGVFIIETIIEQIAAFLHSPNPDKIREINTYRVGQSSLAGRQISTSLLSELITNIKVQSDYERRLSEIAIFNKEHRWRKRGISLMPLKYDIGYYFFNFTALVSIYYSDGTVAVSHGGIEMGQGITTRICQVVAAKLAIPLDMITVKSMSTLTSPNSVETGASITSELNCVAVLQCCEILLERIEPVRQKFPTASWKELMSECGKARVDLSAKYMHFAPEKAEYAYSTHGAACSEAEIDVLTGERHIVRSDIMFACGESINPRIDVGQLEGSFVMGAGFFLTERVKYDWYTGKPLSVHTWNYLPPTSKDIPTDMRVYVISDSSNPIKIIRSKAVGEPAICLASTCFFAIKRAIDAARAEIGVPAGYFSFDNPASIDKILNLCLLQSHHLTI